MNQRLIQLAERADAPFWRLEFDALSEPQKVFRAVWELEAEVNNGGFLQYLENSSGQLAAHAANALRAIGANVMADVVAGALHVAGAGASSPDEGVRAAAVAALPPDRRETLDELDRAFLGYPENLTVLLYAYVALHPGDF
jgi:hypothetical protein